MPNSNLQKPIDIRQPGMAQSPMLAFRAGYYHGFFTMQIEKVVMNISIKLKIGCCQNTANLLGMIYSL